MAPDERKYEMSTIGSRFKVLVVSLINESTFKDFSKRLVNLSIGTMSYFQTFFIVKDLLDEY